MFGTDLHQMATARREHYSNAKPFPHAVFDDVFEHRFLQECADNWPPTNHHAWHHYENGKQGMQSTRYMHESLSALALAGCSGYFLKFLRTLTGIDTLISDRDLRGGGLHQTNRNGYLGIHVDFNRHKKLYRRLNVLCFLNPTWEDGWHGDLELRADPSKFQPGDVRVSPQLGTVAIFDTHDKSWHGHPNPLKGPVRRSFAWYYYTREEPAEYVEQHGTIYH